MRNAPRARNPDPTINRQDAKAPKIKIEPRRGAEKEGEQTFR